MGLRIAHCLLQTAHGVLSYADLTSGGRGATGSEQTMLQLARAQAHMGHSVLCYLPTDTPGFAEGVELRDVRLAWPRLRRLDSADVVISWLSADPLRGVRPEALRVLAVQINDWLLSACGYQEFVDVYVACSEAHRAHLLSDAGNPGSDVPFEIIPNGVDAAQSGSGSPRVPRRCVYLSSPDRGLHWLLAMWPDIRFAFPDAELHIFYEIQQWLANAVLLSSDVGLRARYVVARVPALKLHGVHLRGAVPPRQIVDELQRADVMVYPCDPVRFTEGFSCAVLDACATGTVPIITDADALGEVYGESGALVVPRTGGGVWTDRFLEMVLDVFSHPEQIEGRRQRVQEFARQYDWTRVAGRWMEMIERRLALKGGNHAGG